ncbi:MAG: hypothetical protein NTX85_02410 [Candidatus Nomurabacteria bacterium]|nr:hypothetical protein [Candidatus Nomurabacteria bacterium]
MNIQKYTKSKGLFCLPDQGDLIDVRNRLDSMGFEKVSKEEILISHLDNNLGKPKRATTGNAVQDQYRRISKTGYSVYIHSGLIDDHFSEKGSSWVLILNEKNERVWMREFYRNFGILLLKKLLAYARFASNICDGRLDGDELVEFFENRYEWRSSSGKFSGIVLNYKNYLYDLSIEEKRIVSQKERIHDSYLKATFGKVLREKDFRATWKD